MERSKNIARFAAGILTILCISSIAAAQLKEPTPINAPAPYEYRGLRSDYVRNWYIYSDDNSDGILKPGDSQIGNFKNWWSTIGAGDAQIQYPGPYAPNNYMYPDDNYPTNPMNYTSRIDIDPAADPNKNWWMPMDSNDNADQLRFYMTYSQWENNSPNYWANYDNGTAWGKALSEHYYEQNKDVNAYALGWVTHTIKRDAAGNIIDDLSSRGTNVMDIYVHNGKFDGYVDEFGSDPEGKLSWSNPQVVQSNDINSDSIDPSSTMRHIAKYDDDPASTGYGTYSEQANEKRDAWNKANGMAGFDVDSVFSSMKIREVDPMGGSGGPGANDWEAIHSDLKPSDLAAYGYQDAVVDRGTYIENASDGGVVTGLSGEVTGEGYADQQVIRIDLGDFNAVWTTQDELDGLIPAGKNVGDAVTTIDEILFYDFGASTPGAAGTQQTAPTEIVFGIDRTRTMEEGQIYCDLLGGGRVYFPDNRLFIAVVDPVPEPTTLALLAIGGAGLIWKRRRNRK
jgi:hypothetical protein